MSILIAGNPINVIVCGKDGVPMDVSQGPKRGSARLHLCDKQGVNDCIRKALAQVGVTIVGERPSISGKPEVDIGRSHLVGTKAIGLFLETLRH